MSAVLTNGKTKQDANGQLNTYLKAFILNLFVEAIITKKTEQLAEVKSLTLSISKSKFMIISSSQRLNKIDSISFKIDNMDLDEVSSFKYLGIVINNRLTIIIIIYQFI